MSTKVTMKPSACMKSVCQEAVLYNPEQKFLLFQLKGKSNKKIKQRRQAPRVLSSPAYGRA
jgi:hypothetical protein